MDGQTPAPRVDSALAGLRRHGERVTPARDAVLRVVDAADRAHEHLSAEQIGSRVAELAPAVHRATVYRTLAALCEAGALTHVHLGGSATVYHLATPAPATHGHVHVQCVTCGRVQDAPSQLLDDAAGRLRTTLGFELDVAHAALLGTCSDCSGG